MLDEQTLEDLVAGQLTGERYRAALRALDADPKLWRECALAFLEDQALRTELRELAKGTIEWRCDEEKNDASVNVNGVHLGSSAEIVPTTAAGKKTEAASLRWSSHLLSTAALLMVSFTVGWLGSELLAEREQLLAPKNNAVVTTSNPVGNAIGNATSRTPLQADLPQADITPQFVLDRPGQFMPLDHEIPQPFLELERQGKVQLESKDGLVPHRMADGTTVFFPVQEVRVIPVTLSF